MINYCGDQEGKNELTIKDKWTEGDENEEEKVRRRRKDHANLLRRRLRSKVS